MSNKSFTPGPWENSDTKWTPGPWIRCDAEAIVGKSGHGWFVRVSDKRVISVEGRTEDEAEANVHLIAAAPVLAEELRKASQLCRIAADWNLDEIEIDGEMVSVYELQDAFDSALAKARGEGEG